MLVESGKALQGPSGLSGSGNRSRLTGQRGQEAGEDLILGMKVA